MMNKYQEINERIEAAAEEARKNKGIKTQDEIKRNFFKGATELFNEHIAGDITLADGKKVTIPEI